MWSIFDKLRFKSWNQGLKKKPGIENYKPVIFYYKPKFQIETCDCNLQT